MVFLRLNLHLLNLFFFFFFKFNQNLLTSKTLKSHGQLLLNDVLQSACRCVWRLSECQDTKFKISTTRLKGDTNNYIHDVD